MNVVRPAGYENATLPVLVWIHGGGYTMGGAADKRYNLTFLVQNSVALGKPIVAASFQCNPYLLQPNVSMSSDPSSQTV